LSTIAITKTTTPKKTIVLVDCHEEKRKPTFDVPPRFSDIETINLLIELICPGISLTAKSQSKHRTTKQSILRFYNIRQPTRIFEFTAGTNQPNTVCVTQQTVCSQSIQFY
jgi:hypothetical protein